MSDVMIDIKPPSNLSANRNRLPVRIPIPRKYLYEALYTFMHKYKTVSVHLHDKCLRLRPLKGVYDRTENLGYSLALYSFSFVTIDLPKLCVKRKITQGLCCGKGT